MKSYDTAWAAMLIKQYLAPDGYVVSLQNCMNEETIAGIVGWGKTLGCIASSITVNLPEPGLVHRGAAKHGAAHTVFRAGEVHGRITERAEEVCRLVAYADRAKVTDNLWGERWSKLVTKAMQNGISACTGLGGGDMIESEPIRRFSTRSAREGADPCLRNALAVANAALGYQLEENSAHPAGDDCARRRSAMRRRCAPATSSASRISGRTAAGQRPSMGADMQKGRRTEIEFLNGLIVREGETSSACPAGANATLTDLVKRVEKRRAKADSEKHHRLAAELAMAPYTGTRTVARKPPSGESPSVMSPPCERAMSRAMARPRPVPPSS